MGSPPIHLPYLTGESKVEVVDRSLLAREHAIQLMKHHLQRAQNRMKQIADSHRTERTFKEGDWVYMKLQPYRQTSVASNPNQKLVARYYGPYMITDKIGPVAYKLVLPTHSQIHPVLHVSRLKKHQGSLPSVTANPPTEQEHESTWEPDGIIDKRIVKKRNQAVVRWLVRWKNKALEDAT